MHDNAIRTYNCHVLIYPEEGGGFSAHAIRLPGVVSEGETIDEALENVKDAFQATLQAYLEDDGVIPWEDDAIERVAGCEERWVLVNV